MGLPQLEGTGHITDLDQRSAKPSAQGFIGFYQLRDRGEMVTTTTVHEDGSRDTEVRLLEPVTVRSPADASRAIRREDSERDSAAGRGYWAASDTIDPKRGGTGSGLTGPGRCERGPLLAFDIERRTGSLDDVSTGTAW